MKAIGAGLSMELDTLDVSSVERDGIGRLRDEGRDLPITFTSVEPGSGYVGTVTLGGTRIVPVMMPVASA